MNDLALRLHTARELARYFVGIGQWWLVPMLVVLLLTTLILIGVQAVEYVAPFVYTIF